VDGKGGNMSKLVDLYFSDPDMQSISDAVQKAEQNTSGELAVRFNNQSKHWRRERLLYATFFALVGMLIAIFATRESNWGVYYHYSQAIMWGILAFLFGYFIWSLYLRRESRLRKVVWDKALKLFPTLPSTRGQTGVLIYVSLRENQAAIVADKAIAMKLSPDYWEQPLALLIRGMREGHHTEGIIEAVKAIGEKLAQYFPRLPDDKNELPDEPIVLSD